MEDLKALFAILLVAAFIGIGVYFFAYREESLTSGIILSKHYSPAHSYSGLQPILVNKITIMMPVTRYVGDHWTVQVRGRLKDGSVVRREVEVSQSVYEFGRVGDSIRLAE